MKKHLTIVIMMVTTCSVYAQLEVDAIGKVNINSPVNTPARVNIEGESLLLKGRRYGSITQYDMNPAIEGQNNTSGIYWATGLRGISYGSGGTSNCGVFGMSTEGGAYKNFGVMGCLYSNGAKGAGILGTTNWLNLTLSAFTKSYAGYFDGDVHIQGNVTYSGSLTGNVLLSSAPPTGSINANPRSEEGSLAADNLSGLELQTYYHPIPEKTAKQKVSEVDFTGMDSLEIEAIRKSLTDEEVMDVIGEQIIAKQHYALDAEQLEEIFPDLVYDNEDGTKSINYVEMVPILVQAINELSAKIEILESKDGTIKKVKAQATSVDGMGKDVTFLALGQNKPNPFGTSTNIEVSIPENVQKAFVYVYDLTGKKLQQVDIPARGKQTVTLNAATLSDGMYLYSLIADGKVVETKRMIVEK